jgi:plastocyanin
MNKGPVIAGLIVLVLLAGGAFALTSNKDDNKAATSTTSTSSQTSTSDTSSTDSTATDTAAAATITYDGSSFSPSSTTVKSGDKVTIKNVSSGAVLDFDSDPHPVHTDDTDLNAGSIEAGQSKTVTVTKKGSFGFHNHDDPTQKGQITIQ